MRHSLLKHPQFYVTAPQPCPYLEDRHERKLFTTLYDEDGVSLNNSLSAQGFRRSQNVIYRPSCSACSACQSARVKVEDFSPSRSQKRVLKRNGHLTRSLKTPWARDAHFQMFNRYLESRHAKGGMAGMDESEFSAMIEETPVNTRLVEYSTYKNGRSVPVAVCLSDILEDGLSMVYSFFEPELAKDSIGTYMILDHIRLARESGLPYVYLGYWVQGSPKMDYKSKFQPLETYHDGGWHPLKSDDSTSPPHPLDSQPISRQVAAIHLPRLESD
ncbi:MAG: arginyltransferase [Rhodobacteraceae bacterium]|nr:arginyltransferase [Paracoccaceae bacterium]